MKPLGNAIMKRIVIVLSKMKGKLDLTAYVIKGKAVNTYIISNIYST